MLAGVSASWYTWLEQGRDIKVSENVLDAVSSALRLSDAERAHLYRLTGTNPPQPLAQPGGLRQLARIVDNWLPGPAYVIDRYWNTVAANALARALPCVGPEGHNQLLAFFGDPGGALPACDETARRLVGQFRAQVARFPDDPEFTRITRLLLATSAAFRHWWARHEIENHAISRVKLRLTDGSDRVFEQTVVVLPQNPDLRLVLHATADPAA